MVDRECEVSAEREAFRVRLRARLLCEVCSVSYAALRFGELAVDIPVFVRDGLGRARERRGVEVDIKAVVGCVSVIINVLFSIVSLPRPLTATSHSKTCIVEMCSTVAASIEHG